MASQLALCHERMPKMTVLMPGVNSGVPLASFDRTMVNMTLLVPGMNMAAQLA